MTLRILETCLYCPDLEAAANFYRDVLGLSLVSQEPGRHLFFRCSGGMLLLFNAEACSHPGGDIPHHGATGPGHVAFAIKSTEVATWRERLTAAGVAIETEINWPRGNVSLYFRDPAGNSLELAPAGIWRL
ncbi:MAG: VOC family protein [bacterium]|nr:VOC family protein [bacterium]